MNAFLLVPGCVNTMIRTRGDRWVEGAAFKPEEIDGLICELRKRLPQGISNGFCSMGQSTLMPALGFADKDGANDADGAGSGAETPPPRAFRPPPRRALPTPATNCDAFRSSVSIKSVFPRQLSFVKKGMSCLP